MASDATQQSEGPFRKLKSTFKEIFGKPEATALKTESSSKGNADNRREKNY